MDKDIESLTISVVQRSEQKVPFLLCLIHLSWSGPGIQISPPSQFPSLLLLLIKWCWLHSDGQWRLILDMYRIHLANLIKATSKSRDETKAWIIAQRICKGQKYRPPFNSDSNYLSKSQNTWKKKRKASNKYLKLKHATLLMCHLKRDPPQVSSQLVCFLYIFIMGKLNYNWYKMYIWFL